MDGLSSHCSDADGRRGCEPKPRSGGCADQADDADDAKRPPAMRNVPNVRNALNVRNAPNDRRAAGT